jgi:Mlc titration factor MtfA (ptsG expression regulator)
MEAINDNHSDIRKYGGTNQAEFFAVASEYFFERPDLLKKKHPELYRMLSECFNQNLRGNVSHYKI